MPLSPVIAFAQVEFDPGNVIHHLGLSSFTALLWSRYYRLILHQLGTSLAARQLAADETNILITLLLGHSSSSQGTHAVSHFSPAWVSGIVAAMVVVTQDNLTLDQILKALKNAQTERTHAAILI